MTKTRLRVIQKGDIAGTYGYQLLLVDTDDDGNETTRDITTDLRHNEVTLKLRVGEVSRATIHAICVGAEIDAFLDDLVVKHVGPSRLGRLWWRMKKWCWGVNHRADATSLSSKMKQYVQ